MYKNLSTLFILSIFSCGVQADESHHPETHRQSFGHEQSALVAQLLPTVTGQFGSGTVHIQTHAHHSKSPTSLEGKISIPIGITALNTDAISLIESLTVTLVNANTSLNCSLSADSIDFTPISGGTGYNAVAQFSLHQITQGGQPPVYLAGSCTSVPDSFSASDSVTATVFSGKVLLSTLTGSLK